MKYLLEAKWLLMAWRDAVCCFFGCHDPVKLRGIMPFCRVCGDPIWKKRWWQ